MKSQIEDSLGERLGKQIYVTINHEDNNVRKLIINADDFGLIKERDQGIIELIDRKRVTSLSVIINGNNVDQASKRIKSMIFKQSAINHTYQINHIPNFSIGLHFNLTQGPALCQTLPCPLLCPQTKSFLGKPSFYTLLNQLKPLPLPTKQFIKCEFRLQLQKFIQTFNIRPSHIDGHNHVHVVREVAELIVPIMRECGVYRVRVPVEGLERPEENAFNEVFVGNAREARQVYDGQGVVYPGHFVGLEEINRLDLGRIEEKINSITKQKLIKIDNSFIQLMCHPGYPSLTSTDPFHSSPDRLTQYNSLNSLQFQQKFLTNPTLKLSTFNDLCQPVNSFSKKRILLYSKMNSGSGNWTTSLRLQQIFQTLGYQVYLRSIEQSVQPSYQVQDLRKFLISFKITLIIGVNLTRSGTIVHNATRHPSHPTYKVPYLFIVAGTDANIYFNKPQAPNILSQPIKQCQLLISLSQSMLHLTNKFLTTKLNYHQNQKPVILLSQSSNISFYQRKDKQEKQNIYQCLKDNYRLDVKKERFVVFPASFRPVKDIEYCLKEFNQMIGKYQGLRVLILGPVLDQVYYEKCKTQLGRVEFLGSLQKELYVEVLKHAIILVNTSISQGQSCSIQQGLEAGQLCVVRNNPGNAQLIKHKETGFLYDTPEQFVQIFDQIMRNQNNFTEKIKQNALEYHRQHFSVQAQAKSYKKIFDSILPQKPILFTYPDVHPVSKVNIGLYNQVPEEILVQWYNQSKQHKKRMIDLGCGSGIFSFTVVNKLPQELQKQINLQLYDFSSSILSNTYYNCLQQSCSSLKSIKSLTLQQSDMFSHIPNPSESCLYLANMPQCPFQCQTSRPDKNGGLDSLKYNEILLRTFATFSEQSLLVMLYSYMAWPKRFFGLVEELGLEIVWKGERVSFFVKGEEYEKMQKGLVEFLKGHIREGRAQVEVMAGDNGSKMFIVPAQMLAIKKKSI